jgi:beta-glucosidase
MLGAIAVAPPLWAQPADDPSAAVAHPALWPVAHSPAAITDPATEARITALLARMTVEQKVGQVVQADISTIKPEDLAAFPLGSIIAGGNSGPYENERASAADWNRLVGSFREVSRKPAANGIGIPIIFGVDAVHGHSNLPNATIFPHNIGLGAAHDPDLIRRIGAVTADEVSASGIEWTFAPTLTVPQDVRWGRSYEGYSSDPKLVAQYSGAMVEGLQGKLVAGRPIANDHVAATPKHFLADGGTSGGKDQGDARIGEAELIAKHAQGYVGAIDTGALTVMVSFSGWNGVKNHGNASLLTGALKGRMGFEGLVVGDWNAHGQIPGCTVTDCDTALLAGLDLYMAPDSWKGLYTSLLEHARAGRIPAARLDDAVRRILRVKAKLGLLDGTRAARLAPGEIGRADHLALAREAVAKSLVLLKNNGSVLPIRPGAKILVAGPGANNMAMQDGGWTVSWQGSDVTHADFTNGQTIFEAISAAAKANGGTAVLSESGRFEAKPDVAIVVYGEKPYAEFQGDIPTLKYQPAGSVDLALLKQLKAAGVPVVSVFLSGRPLFTSPEINASDAFVAAWLPGTQADGIADVLIAAPGGKPRRDFSGTLSFPWPADARSPIAKPLFPLGYGLSYASPKAVGALAEAPRMDVAAALNVQNFLDRGKVLSPWSMTLTDAGGARTVAAGAAESPGRALSQRPVDLAAQEDARQFRWGGQAAVNIIGPPADLSRQLNNAFALRLDLRMDSLGAGPVTISVGNTALDATALLRALQAGARATVKIPLRCFADAGANLGSVDQALKIEGGAGLGLTLQSARVEAVGEPLACPPAAK